MKQVERLVVVFGEEEDKDALLKELGRVFELTDRRSQYSITMNFNPNEL